MGRLRRAAAHGWTSLNAALHRKAADAYSVADASDFTHCVFHHLTAVERSAMVVAELYECPRCGRLLKDRGTPVAASILMERQRLRKLWVQVEQAGNETEREQAMAQFRAGLGIG